MYVKRDDKGQIVAVSTSQELGFDEQLDPESSELKSFLQIAAGGSSDSGDQIQQLRLSDVALARVVEDIINLLTDKGIIQFTELPEAAQNKLLQRKLLRSDIRRLDLLAEEDTDDLVP